MASMDLFYISIFFKSIIILTAAAYLYKTMLLLESVVMNKTKIKTMPNQIIICSHKRERDRKGKRGRERD